jgi:hypothetical protein
MPVCMPAILPAHQPTSQSTCLLYQHACLSVRPLINLFTLLPVCLSTCWLCRAYNLHAYLPAWLSTSILVNLPTFRPVCISNWLLIFLPAHLPACLSSSLLIYLTAEQHWGLSDCKLIVLPVYRPAGFSSHLLYLLPAFYLPAYLSPSLSTYTLINWHAYSIYLPAHLLISTIACLSIALPSCVSSCIVPHYLLYLYM